MISIRAELAAVPVLVCLAAAPAMAATRIASPLTAVASAPAGPVTTLALDAAAIERLRQVESVTLMAFPLDAATTVDLDLRRFEVLTPDAEIVVHTDGGIVHAAPPRMVLLRGRVAGEAHSQAFLSLTPRGANGYVRTGGKRYVIAGARPGRDAPTVIYDPARLPAGSLHMRPFTCGTPDVLPAFPRVEAAPAAPAGAAAAGASSCEIDATVAIETDWEFTDSFGGDTDASGAYALTLMAAVSTIYVTDDPDDNDVGVGLAVSHLSLWDTPSDPWTATTAQGLLEQFRDYWNSTQGGVERNTAHFLSTRVIAGAGGIAYLPGLCQGEWAYGLSTRIEGSFPMPLEIDGSMDNWDLVVVAHELGHNFGAPHTHSMDPPVDECAYGVCEIDPDSGVVEGTLMSYCHLCDENGVLNINLWFHDRTLDEWIHPYLETGLPCTLGSAPPEITAQPQSIVRCEGDPAFFSVTVSSTIPVDYQWRHNTLDIPGATSSLLSIPAVGPADFGTYDVVVSSACVTLQSDPAQLSMDLNCDPGGGTGCPADLNGDNFVGINDFLDLLAQWGSDPGGPPDFNGDNTVGINDFLFLLANWGAC